MNYRVTLANYKEDKYYPKVVKVMGELLSESNHIKTTDVFVKLGVLSIENMKKWLNGQVSDLERVIECNLSKANRILNLVGFHAHDLNLGKDHQFCKRKGKVLRFTKTGYKKGEELYARQFYVIGKQALTKPSN